MRKIGLFGGTFNPVHNAHISIAEYALDALGLDFVIMLTGGNPPHKKNLKIPDAKLRHIMLKMAVENNEKLIACDFEVNRKEFSYTVNTLEFFKRVYPDDKLYFIMGGDSLDYFEDWYKPERIAKLATLSVYGRGKAHRFDFIKDKYGAEIVNLNGEFYNVSSTNLRKNPDVMRKQVPERVYNFIRKYKLYQLQKSDIEILSDILSEDRLKHSIGVAKMAKHLGELYNEDAQLLERAGLLHDAAKCIPYHDALVMCDELEAEIDPIERTIPALVHPKLGAELVKCLFGITEGKITSAIRCHTVGKSDMTLFDKILFVSDMCEDGRVFPGVNEIRNTAYADIDKAVLMCIEKTIEYNSGRKLYVHPMAYHLRELYLANL
ncbi:MAG: nicotinate (nicotinamide) nucleotide adenylyltransferase [Eubacteriales bacterium]|nr:nicotinate (nicotinamide) nucleotide adenylyltransferase [Eubacteriales bacterium]